MQELIFETRAGDLVCWLIERLLGIALVPLPPAQKSHRGGIRWPAGRSGESVNNSAPKV